MDYREYRKKYGSNRKDSKYRSQWTEVDGINFQSKKEAEYYIQLKLLQAAGEVAYFLRQVPFHLPGNIKYFCDFMVVMRTGQIRYIDVKGVETNVFKMKKKMVEYHYPIKIELV